MRAKLRLGNAEDAGDVTEIGVLRLVDRAIGGGDQEQAVQHILEQGRLVLEGGRDLAGIGLEPGAGLLGEVEQALDPRLLLRWTW